MALIKCPKCGKQFSEHAENCPQCGTSKEDIPRLLKELKEREAAERERLRKEQDEKNAEEARLRAEKREVWWKQNRKWFIPCIVIFVVSFSSYVAYVNRNTIVASSSKELSIFRFRKTLHIVIPDGITSIGYEAFRDCKALTSVTIPSSVRSIESFAFYGCSVHEIHYEGTIGEWVAKQWSPEMISYDYALYIKDELLTDLVIPESVTMIEKNAFEQCSSLTSVAIPKSVTSIGDNAFYDCSSLISITVAEDNLQYCSVDGVLFNKNKTTLIQYPAGKTATSYVIPSNVASISNHAFKKCRSLASVTIPNSVTTIGYDAFYYCRSLISVVWNAKYCEDFNHSDPFSQSSISSFVFGEDVEHIPANLFFNCHSLTSVEIPNSVKSIGCFAFSADNLTSLTIPESVTWIGKDAFWSCTKLNITLPERFRGRSDLNKCKSVTYY